MLFMSFFLINHCSLKLKLVKGFEPPTYGLQIRYEIKNILLIFKYLYFYRRFIVLNNITNKNKRLRI